MAVGAQRPKDTRQRANVRRRVSRLAESERITWLVGRNIPKDRSILATKKITRAMELIAASRIVKAQGRVQAAVPYANGITDVVRNLQGAGGGVGHPMLVERPTRSPGSV